jgi:hypothetical protein
MNSKKKNIRDLYRGMNEFKEGYQHRNNLVKDENGDLLTDSHDILNSWKYFSQNSICVMSVMLGKWKYIRLNH